MVVGFFTQAVKKSFAIGLVGIKRLKGIARSGDIMQSAFVFKSQPSSHNRGYNREIGINQAAVPIVRTQMVGGDAHFFPLSVEGAEAGAGTIVGNPACKRRIINLVKRIMR